MSDREAITRTVVLIPTYNERDNLAAIVGRVRAAAPHVDICVLDDNSPDGTGEIADRLASADAQVTVIHRERKEGLGAAYLEGFAWSLDQGYDAVVEMDADGSHLPEDLTRLLDTARHADLVIGSRWVSGGSVQNWPLFRTALSVGGNRYIRVVTGTKVRDATAGFRVYRAATLRNLSLETVESTGYCFQVDLTLRAESAGLVILEVPITFVEREQGESKMAQTIISESLHRITRWGIERRSRQVRKGLAEVRERLTPRERWHQL